MKAALSAAIRRQSGSEDAGPTPEPTAPAPTTAAPTVPTQGDGAQPTDTAGAGGAPKLYGMLSRSIRGPLTYAAWMFKEGPGIAIHSPKMTATGTVIADASVPLADYELGFVQALIVSNMTATYTDKGGRPVRYFKLGVSQLPIRDSEKGSKPWMKKGDVKSLDEKDGYIVNTADRPNNAATWQSDDKSGSLSSAEGNEYFCTWLAARHKPSGQMHYLGWGTWTVDWASTFDAESQTGKSTGAGGQEAQSGDKRGPHTPLEGDPVANGSITTAWSSTP